MVSDGEAVSSRALRVIVCDDTPQVRVLIKTELSLEPDMIVVGEAVNGAEAIDLARSEQPDVVLLDLGMPVMDGLEALPEIKEAAPTARVIVYSSFEVSEMAEKAVAAGASRYIEKSAPAHQIVAAVRTTD
jgi:DNA-binding NarL/FixJ family response regulator